MEKDILVILMIAFGIFAILMFILFYVYLKKYYNDKHIEQDFEQDIIKNEINDDNLFSNENEVNNYSYLDDEIDDEFMPRKKK